VRKLVLTYGLFSGGIVGALLMSTLSMYLTNETIMENGMLIGYSTMVISLSLIFFGIKSLRDNQYNGSITFGKAAQVGLLITLIASVIYAGAWEISYSKIGNDFNKKMQEQYYEQLQEEGLSEAELQEEKEKIDTSIEYYKNPVIRFGITLTEVFPVGIILTLISAGLLRKKEFLPVYQNPERTSD
jgi:hypothetical protein